MVRKEDMRFDTLRRAAALGLACVLVWGGVPAPALAEMVEEADVPAADTVADDPKDADAALEAQGSTKADAEVPEAEPAPVAVDDLPLEDAAAPVQQDSADAEVPAISVQADGDYIARGTWGNCPWEIDSSGTLTVRRGEGASQSSSVSPWDSWKDSISSIRFVAEGNRDVVAPSDCSYLFAKLSHVTSVDLAGLNTSSVTNMSSMFSGCTRLASLDLSNWNTSCVTDMGGMFEGCSSLVTINGLSGWTTSSVTDMSDMFFGCKKLASLDLSGWNTASANRTAEMFAGCMSLESISVGANYQIKGADMLPEVTAPNGMWWSTRDHWWYTEDDVVLERSGVADTYTSVAEPGFAVNISAATVASIKGHGYDGKPYEPKPEVTLGSRKLVEGTDFDYSYKNNVSASNGGSATVTVTGKNNYTGTKTVGFDIWKMGQPMEAWKVARSASAASLATRDVVVEAPIHVAHAVSAGKPMEYNKKGGDGRIGVDKATGRVTVRKGTPAGTYPVTIRAIAFGGANYADGSKVVDCQVKVVSGKLDQEMEVKAADVSRTAASLASADYLTRPFSVALAAGNVTYKLAGGSGCLGVGSSGRLRITRGTKAGTYYAKVWVTAAGDVGYKPCTRTVTAKVVVR